LSARHSETHPHLPAIKKLLPHLYFNAGRIAFFAVFGGVLGGLGRMIQLSPLAIGAVTVFVSLFMAIIGLRLTNMFPVMGRMSLAMPKSLGRITLLRKDGAYSPSKSFLAGAPTFFLPCGFTQAMQLLSVSTGSVVWGALVMGIFAAGTAPGLLGIAGLSSFAKGKTGGFFYKFAGLAVIVFSIYNLSNSLNLLHPGSAAQPAVGKIPSSDIPQEKIGGAQIVRMKELRHGYSPDSFKIKNGVPVKWIIDAEEPYSCAASLVVPSLGISKQLARGENIIEFTPREPGRINFSCSMGMYTGYFMVE
jgi:sulfite exporter TauE/SafE